MKFLIDMLRNPLQPMLEILNVRTYRDKLNDNFCYISTFYICLTKPLVIYYIFSCYRKILSLLHLGYISKKYVPYFG